MDSGQGHVDRDIDDCHNDLGTAQADRPGHKRRNEEQEPKHEAPADLTCAHLGEERLKSSRRHAPLLRLPDAPEGHKAEH